MKDNEQKYFVVSNVYLANGIAFASKEKYYRYEHEDGKLAISFKRTDRVLKAYYFLCNMRFGDEKFPIPLQMA